MDACNLVAECTGVTYAHKFWGGANSQGFTLGYGF